jgi:hypothetical protein
MLHFCLCVGICIRVCALALLIQHATHMRYTVTSFVASLAPPYFLSLSHKWHDFRNNFCLKRSKKNLPRYCHKCENVFM